MKNSKFEIAGVCLLLLFTNIWFYNCEFFGGGDLGVSANFLSAFARISRYAWNDKFELGKPNELSLSWYLYYSFLSFFDNQEVFVKYVLFFGLPLIVTYILLYRAFYRLHRNSLLSFIVGLAFILNPLSVRVYLSVPIHTTYYLYPFVAYLFYIFSMIYKAEFEIKKVLVLGFLIFPMLIMSFSNVAYPLPAILAFLLLMAFNKVADLKNFGLSLLPLVLLSSFFLLPFTLSVLFATSSFGLPTNVPSLLGYVRAESQSVKFYENFLPSSPIAFAHLDIVFLILSSITLIISFLPMMAITNRRMKTEDSRLYFCAVFLFIIGVFLSKGISQPFGEVNSVLYQLLSPFSFAFRSPFSKFPIITLVSMTIMFYYGLRLLMAKAFPFRFVMCTVLLLMIIIGFSFKEISMQQGLYFSENSYTEHIEGLDHLLNEYGIAYDERVLLLPINYGVFSLYNFSVNEIYRGASNEYAIIGRPIVSNYQWRQNTYLTNIIFHSQIGDIEGLRRDLIIGNVKCLVIDHFKESGEYSSIDSSSILSSLEKLAVKHERRQNWEILLFNEAFGRFYQVGQSFEIINKYQIFPANTSIVPVTFAANEVCVSNNTLYLHMPSTLIEGATDFMFPQEMLLNSSDLSVNINLKIDKPETVSAIYFGLNTKEGYITFLLPKPYKIDYEYSVDVRSLLAVHNFTMISPIIKARLSIWKDNGANETLNAEVREIVLSEKRNNSTISHTRSYEYVNPTLWRVRVNATEPFVLSFSESYSSLWEAKIYKEGALVEVAKPVPLFSVVNGFWINQTGLLDITVEYVPQRWFFYGSIISLFTFLICTAYLTYTYTKTKHTHIPKPNKNPPAY